MDKHQDTIREFCDAVNRASPEPPPVILIGSVARNSETPKSDVDLLIVADHDLKIPAVPHNFHLHVTRSEDFLRKLREGDDLSAWCVRFGVPIQDAGKWNQIVHSVEAETWPNWRKKILHATRRLLMAKALLLTGDVEAASEETLYAASHAARAILLKSKIFPLARAELISQTRTAGNLKLAQILETLLFNEVDESEVTRAIQFLKKLLIDLDQAEFRRFSQAFSEMAPLSRRQRSNGAEQISTRRRTR